MISCGPTGRRMVRRRFRGLVAESVRAGLHGGIGAAADQRRGAHRAPPPIPATNRPSGLDLLFRPDPYILDGRYANNAWLQELPKPITKLTWDNAVLLAPRQRSGWGWRMSSRSN